MQARHIQLYRTLGYKGSLRADPSSPEEGTPAFALPRDISTPSPRDTPRDRPEISELPPLGPEDLEKLQAQLDADPAAILAWARQAYDSALTEDQLRAAIGGRKRR